MTTRDTRLSRLKVGDIRNMLVKTPATVQSEATLDELLRIMIADPRTRHVYVVDKNNVLLGAVRMNTVVEYLFPFEALIAPEGSLYEGMVPHLTTETVAGIMNVSPRSVGESTTLGEMATILMNEKINELPVVDDERHVVGQINIYEVIQAYLAMTESQSD